MWQRVETNLARELFRKHSLEATIEASREQGFLASGKQLQEMEQMADVMGHDVSTAQSVYIKKADADVAA